MTEIIQTYYGVQIQKSCGRFYPSVNGNVECETIYEVKQYIRSYYIPYVNGMKKIAKAMNVNSNLLLNATNSIFNL